MKRPRITELKIYRRRLRWKLWKSRRNAWLNSLPKDERIKAANDLKAGFEKITIRIPEKFSTSSDIESVLDIIGKCKALNLSKRQILFLDFRKVEVVNAGALALLLSVIQDLVAMKVKIKGNLPRHPIAKKEFVDSGFLEYFVDNQGYSAACVNKILVKGTEKTDQIRTGLEIEKAMLTVFGVRAFNQPIQGALIEMMANAVNHAFPKNTTGLSWFFELVAERKPWYLSVYHEVENGRVHFSFVDNGIGIINTIKRGIYRKIVDGLDEDSILKNAFDGKYKSSTSLTQRGRGLPTVKDAFIKGAIKGLHIVTNNYLYDFENKTGKKLVNSFDGTFYFWTLDKSCVYGRFNKGQQGLH